MRCLSIVVSLCLVITISLQDCPDGWRKSEVIPNKCYYVGIQKKTWFDAEASCQSAQPNAHLTSITSAFENSNVEAVVISTPSDSGCGQFWIGGNDIEQTGQFEWVDGSSWGYARWGPGQPDATQQCVSSTALQNGQWKTEPCGAENCFICEMYLGGSTSSSPITTPSMTTTSAAAPATMTDCWDWFVNGAHTDGIYSINPDGRGSFNVFCDMTTDGGGWTVFQRRNGDSVVFFNETFEEYAYGFGNGCENSYWLGNDNIHSLSIKDLHVELRIDIWQESYTWFEKHDYFYIDNNQNNYTLHVTPISAGNASDIYFTNGCKFGAIDRNYGDPYFSSQQLGGWWVRDTTPSLNGKYRTTVEDGVGAGFVWVGTIDGTNYEIHPDSSRMMLRKVLM